VIEGKINMQKKMKHPNRLRTLIREAGLHIREVRRETEIPESTLYYWAAGNGIIPKEDRLTLAQVIGCSPHDLAPDYDMVELLCESNNSASRQEMAIKRRELLQLLGVAGGALLVSDIDLDCIATSLSKLSHVDIPVIDDLEVIHNRYWNLFMSTSLKSSILDGVLGQLKMQVQFLKEAQGTQPYQRLCTLASSTSQLMGEIFFDLHDRDTAQSCYTFAAMSAKEASAYDLWASALVRHSYLSIFADDFEHALVLLKQAEYIAQRGDSALPTKYWVAATRAEAESGIGNLPACQHAFENAQAVYNLTEKMPAWIRFDGSRLPALQGASYVRLKQPDLAEKSLQQALQESAKTKRRRAMILSDLALAAIQQTNIEQACRYAEEAVTLASDSASGFLRNTVFKIQRQLAPFADVEAVNVLRQQMSVLA
jgi:tetratricopeptide (TPR) repeat protein